MNIKSEEYITKIQKIITKEETIVIYDLVKSEHNVYSTEVEIERLDSVFRLLLSGFSYPLILELVKTQSEQMFLYSSKFLFPSNTIGHEGLLESSIKKIMKKL